MLADSVGSFASVCLSLAAPLSRSPTKNKFCLCNSIWPLRVTITKQVQYISSPGCPISKSSIQGASALRDQQCPTDYKRAFSWCGRQVFASAAFDCERPVKSIFIECTRNRSRVAWERVAPWGFRTVHTVGTSLV
jgi:hypothetical protein